MSSLQRAIAIAVEAHEGQKDKGGSPYILHPLRVMFAVEGDVAKMVAVLHDVIEDTDMTFGRLADEGFSVEVRNAISRLTRHPTEGYDEFIDRVLTDRTACIVKLADLEDNMNVTRLPRSLHPDDCIRLMKYRDAHARIKAFLEGSTRVS